MEGEILDLGLPTVIGAKAGVGCGIEDSIIPTISVIATRGDTGSGWGNENGEIWCDG